MSHIRLIRVFLSSPGDVAQERALAQQVIDNLVHDPLLRDRVALRAVAWDKRDSRTPMLATLTPQEAINQGLPKPSECDIVIVILWARMGTPLPAEYTKPDGSRYQSGTEYEFLDAMTAARNSKERPAQPQVVVYRRKEDVSLKPSDPDFMQKFEQWQRVQDFFQQFRTADGSITGGYNEYTTPDDFRADFENDLKVIISRLLEVPASAAQPSMSPPEVTPPTVWKGSPFPGLRAFLPEDAPIFFGRGREVDGLVARFAEPTCRFVCVVGASGSGKSSLVGAGLIPRLADNAIIGSKDWPWVRFTPGGTGENPFMALASGLIGDVPALKRHYPQPRALAEVLEKRPETLESVLAFALADRPEWAELLVFIDQFEELFTLSAERFRAPFVAFIDRATKTNRLRIAATLRADFYHRCVEFLALAELMRGGTFPLSIPNAGSLYEMISRPADRAALTFEEGLAQQILTDTGNDPGALALMAYALDELYRLATPSTGDGKAALTYAAYNALGGVQGAIGMRAAHVFDTLDAESQAALPSVFHHLVEVDERGTATRQRATMNRIAESLDVPAARLVEALTEARLLVKEGGQNNHPVVEVAHEALLRKWPRLATWIEDTQDDLRLLRQMRIAAEEWENNGRPPYLLWPQERLKLVYAMQERLKPDLNEAECDFIEPEANRLLRELEDTRTTHKRRYDIGDRLSVIGDPRPNIGVDVNGIPDIAWCHVTPGGDIEIMNQRFTVRPFFISKYLITYAQFQAFVEAPDGFNEEHWWEGMPREFKRQEIETPPSQQVNYPRSSMSWYQCTAFARWLDSKYQKFKILEKLRLNPLDYEVRLPTEWEWQWAAQGGAEERAYPWGDWDEYPRVNTTEAGINDRSTAVGMYWHGQAKCGALDMAGNLWEWCANKYTDMLYVLVDKSSDSRVLRGGAFNTSRNNAASMNRNWNNPNFRNDSLGLRVVVAPKSLGL